MRASIPQKLVLAGDACVGKTTLISRLMHDTFVEKSLPTIGAAFHPYIFELGDSFVKFEIWDTAGQERYKSFTPLYFRDARAALVVYDITSVKTYDTAKEFVRSLSEEDPALIVALVGNKLDVEAERAVPAAVARAFAREAGAQFAETSAKTGQNVKAVFRHIALELLRPADEVRASADVEEILSEGEPHGACCK